MSTPTEPAGYVTIAQWDKNDREVIRVALSEFRGKPTIEARVWYRDPAGELQPSRQGLTCNVRHLPSIARALSDALVEHRGLLPDEGGAT